eukprot:Rhum_TRINITY_DN11786_c0_g1::Rhum_TRINITY_DN11786_c0_g1_i1::g.46889::m.46889/K08679/E5.1.3.6; UDP-glucuronate 4-epimerase
MLIAPYAAEAGRRRAGTPQTPRSGAARVQPARGFVVLAVAAALLAAWSHVRARPQRGAAASLPDLPPSSSFLVTGAAGFIGMHVATRLKREGHRVVGLDCYTRYYSTALKEERTRRLAAVGVAVANATVCDERLVLEMLDAHAVTHVVHLAAQPGIELSVTQPRLYIRNNVECFAALLEAMLKARRLPRLVYASSSSVYGHATPPFKEGQPVRPANVYGSTKAQMELLAGVYAQLHGVASAGLRFFTVYGPYMRPDMAVYAFAAKLVQNETITLKGTNLARDFTYVDDVVGGVVRAAGFLSAHSGTAPGEVPCEVFNVGSGAIHPVEEVVTILNALLGTRGVPEYASRTRHDMLTTGASLEKSRQLLRYTPRTHLSDGLASFAAWFTRTRNPEWDFKEHRIR